MPEPISPAQRTALELAELAKRQTTSLMGSLVTYGALSLPVDTLNQVIAVLAAEPVEPGNVLPAGGYANLALVALRACDEALTHHDDWCGHRPGSPGHVSFNRAERLLRRAIPALEQFPGAAEPVETAARCPACFATDPCPSHVCEHPGKAAPPPAEAPLDADAAYAEECRQAAAWYRERAIATALHERDTLAAQQWQPIETAPKDGSVVWTWTDRQSDRLRALIWARPNLRPQLAKQWVSPVAKCAPTYYPTHWMPLPDPPRALQPTPPETP
jgi:hypothetical protein